MSEEWWKVVLDGSLGTIVGAVVSVIVAVYVVHREMQGQRQLALEERRRSAGVALLGHAYEMSRSCNDMFRHFQDEAVSPASYEDVIDINSRAAFALPFAMAVGGQVVEPYLNLINKAQDFETLLTTAMSPHEYFTALADLQEQVRKVLTAIGAILQSSANPTD